jgi:metallo-beta-lactamase family protein
VFATPATVDLLRVMLLDAAHIQEKETEWRRRASRHGKRGQYTEWQPLYTVSEAEICCKQLRAVDYEAAITPHPHVRCRLRDAGHILGAAIIEVWVDDRGGTRKLVFSGDIGQPGHPVVRDPAQIAEADYLLIESTYGNRLHKSLPDTLKELAHAVNDTLTRKHGNVIVPAFAVGRTQDLIFLLGDLYRQGALPDLQIYVDSPLATQATEITLKHRALLDPQSQDILKSMLARNGRPRVVFVEDVEASMALNRIRSGALIISASGMCDAGRIKHHLAHNLGRRESTIVFTGFQAQGTLGRRIVDGAATVRIFGEEVPVRAEIYTIGGLSAHADQAGLLAWLRNFRHAPRQSFMVHGEAATAQIFRDAVHAQLGWNATVPAARSAVEF